MQLTIESNVGLVRQGMQDLSAEIPKIGRRGFYNAMRRMVTQLKKPGDKPTYPIQWDSEKQRRAFFATNGFGGGIPTKRTGRYSGGWQISRTESGYMLDNRTKYGKYVAGSAYGTGQSRIHRGRWQLFRDVVEKEIQNMPQEIANEIDLVARRVLPSPTGGA